MEDKEILTDEQLWQLCIEEENKKKIRWYTKFMNYEKNNNRRNNRIISINRKN